MLINGLLERCALFTVQISRLHVLLDHFLIVCSRPSFIYTIIIIFVSIIIIMMVIYIICSYNAKMRTVRESKLY